MHWVEGSFSPELAFPSLLMLHHPAASEIQKRIWPSDTVYLFPSGKTKTALSEHALGYIVKKCAALTASLLPRHSFDLVAVTSFLHVTGHKPAGVHEPQDGQEQQSDPDDRAQPLPTWHSLLDDHHPGQDRHPHQAAHADPKYDQHQRPTAAQAEETVAQAQLPGRTHPFAVVAHEETERAAALFETVCLERTELEATGQREGCCTDEPGMLIEPGPTMD